MKTKPEHLPALPEGAVYLGMGGEFTRLSNERVFRGYRFFGTHVGWDYSRWEGTSDHAHYCAPADSEIVKLNTKVANLIDADECPKDPPAGWVRVTEGRVQEHDWLTWNDGDTEWADGLIRSNIGSDGAVYHVYRHPDRFNTPAQSTADPLTILLTPIKRTDEAQAEAYLRWLKDTPYNHNIDDDPTDIETINQHVAPHLRDRNSEAMIALGYNRAWSIFHP